MSTNNKFVCTTDFATSDIVLGFLLSIGIFISFLPQILVLIFRKNVEGLSVISCWFNYANCMGTFLNVLFLNWFVFECCSDWMTHWVCFENLLPVVQMAVPFVTTGAIFALYVIYRPKLPPLSAIADAKSRQAQGVSNAPADSESPENPIVPQSGENSPTSSISSNSSSGSTTPFLKQSEIISEQVDGEKKNKKRKGELPVDSFLMQQGNSKIERLFIRMDWYSQPFFWGTNAATIVFFAIGVGLCYRYGAKSDELSGYAFGMGVMAAILVFFQWIPQIYTTWIADEIGSLSLVSLCIQIPGALLVCYFQLSLKQSWITWFPYLATAVQEMVLVGICVYYLIRDRKKRKAQESEKQVKEQSEIQDNYYQSEPPKPEYPDNENKDINNNNSVVDNIQKGQQQQEQGYKQNLETSSTTLVDNDIIADFGIDSVSSKPPNDFNEIEMNSIGSSQSSIN